MQLYSGPLSLFTAKIRIALAEKRIPYERISVGWSLADRYLPHHPQVVALNPKREVPVLVDGDVVVADSTLILEYLEERHPTPPLYPQGVAERARCRQLEASADEIWFPAIWDLIEEVFYPEADEGRDPQRLAAAHAALADRYRALEEALGEGEHLCADFGVADLATFIMVNAAMTLGAAPDPGLPRVARWIERVGARPTVATEVDEMARFVRDTLAAA